MNKERITYLPPPQLNMDGATKMQKPVKKEWYVTAVPTVVRWCQDLGIDPTQTYPLIMTLNEGNSRKLAQHFFPGLDIVALSKSSEMTPWVVAYVERDFLVALFRKCELEKLIKKLYNVNTPDNVGIVTVNGNKAQVWEKKFT